MRPIVFHKCAQFRDPSSTVLEKFHPKPKETVFSRVFRYNFGPEVNIDVISGATVDSFGMDIRVKFGDSSY